VQLDAGYGGIPERIFIGDINKASNIKQGPDIITKIEAGDSSKKYQEKRVNVTLGPGADTKQAVEAIARAMEVGVGSIKGIVNTVYQQGVTLEGPVKDRMDDVVTKMGLEWSIQDGALQLLPPGTPSETTAIVLSKDTGLLEAPVRTDKGLEFRALLRVAFKPGVSVKIESKFVDGFFKLRKVRLVGDNRKGPFEAQCEAKEIGSGSSAVPTQSLNVPTFDVQGFA